MYCEKCGQLIENNVKFCRICGTPVTIQSPQSSIRPVGFSDRINNQAFKLYKNKSKTWSIFFAFILAIIAVAGFMIYGNVSDEISYPNSLYYGLAIGGMFIAIALLQTLKRGFDSTWDGVVADKKSYRRNLQDDDSATANYENIYELKIKKNSGGSRKHKIVNSPVLYNYYNIGDKVRHHKGFQYYEKYDKSRDSQILCAACLDFNDIRADKCERCKCPLLK